MGRLRSVGLLLAVAIVSLVSSGGCGGHRPPGPNPFPAKVNLNPSSNTSVQLGNTINFSATAQNASNSNVSTTFTFTSSDTSILNIAPNGVACAGVWDAAFTTCTPGGTGVVQVIASALGASSAPTFVFVHPPIDNISVTGVLPSEQIIQEPCLSQGQTMTVQAQAFSKGVDITASVGPFVWSVDNSAVVTVTPTVNSAYNFATNQATAKAVTPGLAHIHASASGVSSTSFQQPRFLDKNNNSTPVFDFFETCLVQSIALEVGHAGSGQTDFAVAKGSSETVVATITDVFGNSSLPNIHNGTVLSKIPLTWTSSQPAVIPTGTGCTQSCSATPTSPGASSITASCSPPGCNIGFPEVPAALATPAALASCAQSIHSLFPQITSCEQFIPAPVYATPLPDHTTAAISGFATGATGSTSVVATSLGCAGEAPSICTVGIYNISTAKALTGTAVGIPDPPNSLLYDLAGSRVYMGSAFGAQVINPVNFGSQTSPFTSLGTVTGKVLAVSPNGAFAIFSDTLHTPNQVYVVNTTNPTAPSATALNISSASVAAFSRDGLKAFIYGLDSNGNPNLYVYSNLQALQVVPLPPQTTVKTISFSMNGAFAYVVEPSLGGAGPAVTVYNTCDNKISQDTGGTNQVIPLSGPPVAFKALPDGVHFLALESNGTIDYFFAAITPISSLTQPAASICPATVSHTVLPSINLGQGTIDPIDFFVSADGTLLYVVASDRSSVIVYSFALGTVTGGIQLAGNGNVAPVAAGTSADASTILIAGSDGLLHQLTTALGGSDQVQLAFPNLANQSNPFCTFTPAAGPCLLNAIAVKP